MAEAHTVPRHEIRVLPLWAVALVVAGVVMLTAGTITAVLLWLDLTTLESEDRTPAQLDALKIGLSIGIGSGGVFALYLAARRQRTTEIDLAHRTASQASADADLIERRITELYSTAADQLGNDKAVVRLAGLYTMERLAQANPEHRQTIIDVLCGYLRMPFAISEEMIEESDPGDSVQELQVRRAAQRILHRHLHPTIGGTNNQDTNYWGELDLDLTGATLINFALGNTTARFVDFRRARFVGTAQFQGARFDSAIFYKCRFDGAAWFESAALGEGAGFDDARFAEASDFSNAVFGNASFERTLFCGDVTFENALFAHNIDFENALFEKQVSYSGARVRIDARRYRVLPAGWIVRASAPGETDRLNTLVPQRWRPRAAVTLEERNMPAADQVWGYVDRN